MPKKKKVVVSGANGQLGKAIRECSQKYADYNFVFTDLAELDISKENSVEKFLATEKPDFFINCAAYTAVDKAEEEEQKAMLLNADAAGFIAAAADKYHCRLIHISTDYVFDGKNYRPYSESHEVSPDSAYGRSKLAGENKVTELSGNAIIIRTSWLYSTTGHNFVKTIRKYGSERDMLKVVYDQIGTPTFAPDLAYAIMTIIARSEKIIGKQIYHFSNEGVCSWYDFAKVIAELSNIKCDILPVETKDYPLPANRPHYSVLNKEKIKQHCALKIPYWKDSLEKCISQLDKSN